MSKKYNLVIVESPAKAKTIEKYLGEDFKVIASVGHIKDLPKKQLGINLETFDLDIEVIDGKEDVIKELILMAKDADEVYLASDPDREGEAIAFHIQETIKRKDAHRVLFNAITKNEILKAIKNPLVLDVKKYEAQKTRRILDRLVGYKISPILWDKLQKGLSAGRVQSVALRLIVEREEEINNFIPEKWYQILAKLKKDDIEFEAKYYGQNITKKTEIENDEQAQAILKAVENQPFIVIDTQTKEKRQYATPPFTTSKLQQEASYKLGFPSKKTMQIAQKLYEGISISGHGRQGLITYMRTDSVRTEPGALTAVREFILNKFGQDYLPEAAVVHIKKKTDSKVQDAHEAIRPTNLAFEPDLIRKDLDPDEFKLYSLIWNKFVASQMNPAILDQTTVSFDVNQNIFKSSGSVVKFPGFKVVYQEEKEEKKNTKGEEDEDKDQSAKLPILLDKESLNPIKPPYLQEKWTTPPARFNEGGLVKELEEKGIGRPSTYAAIISNITDRGYVLLNKEKRFQPTDLGIKLCKMLVANFSTQMDISFTAKMEQNLDAIEDGQENWVEVLKNFWAQLSKTIEEVKIALPSIPKEIRPEDKTDIKCEKCHEGIYLIKKGSNGEFLACSRYPQCKSTKNFKKDKKGVIHFVEPKKQYYEGEVCSTCGKKMVVIKGKNGKFLSCEDYPNCKTSKPMPLDFICHKCEQGKLVERKSKKGNIFYGCSKYPTCDNVLWNKPVKQPCTSCNHAYIALVEGKTKEGKKFKFHQCPKCQKKFEIKKAEK